MSASSGPDLSMFNRFSKMFRKGDIIFCEYEPGDTFGVHDVVLAPVEPKA